MTWALSWYKDDHLLAIVKTLYDWRSLKKLSYYQVHQGRNDDDDLAATVFKYASNVLSRRLWTMSRYGTARECFVGLVSSCVDHRQEAMGVMRRDWRLLNLADVLELSLTCNSCPAPLSGYRVPFSSRVAGTKQVFPGTFVLKGVLTVLPDNKIVEDCHQAVRVEAKSHPNQKNDRATCAVMCHEQQGVQCQRAIPCGQVD